jgi:hypothetical protein
MKYHKWNCNLETKFQLHELTWWWHLLIKGDEIEGNKMSRECAGMQDFSWKTWKRKRQLGRPRHKQENNIKIDFIEIWWDGAN